MATANWRDARIEENVLRRKLLCMDTKSLIKQCKSQQLQYCGNRGAIVNRLLSKTPHIAQSFTTSTKENKFEIKRTSKAKRKKRKRKTHRMAASNDEEIHRIDRLLSIYYGQMGRNDYLLPSGVGKFATFCKRNAFDSQRIKNALFSNKMEHCGLFAFDPQFPFRCILQLNTESERNKEIRDTLRHCYVHNVAPMHTTKQLQKAKITSHSEFKLVINGYIRTLTTRHTHLPLHITNICAEYTDLNVCDLNCLDFTVVLNDDYMVRKVNALYTEQCGDIVADIHDNNVRILAFGYLNRWPQFIQYLADCYIKKMAQKQKNPLNEASMVKYLKSLKWMKQNVISNHDLFTQFVSDVRWYICGMRMTPLRMDAYFERNIRDDSYAIFYYIMGAIQFVNGLIESNHNITPFQFDFCILFKEVKAKAITERDDTDSFAYSTPAAYVYEDSDNSDIEYDYNALAIKRDGVRKSEYRPNALKLDIIGDIHHRLKATKCAFVTTNIDSHFHHNINCDFESELLRTFQETYAAFKRKISECDPINGVAALYPKRNRFVAVVDRRKWIGNEERSDGMKGRDELMMIEPPKSRKCNELEGSDKPLPEHYHEKCAECLIPGIYFNEEFKESQYAKSRYDELSADVSETINCVSNTNGSMMTLSFHCEAEDQLKCYLWFATGHLRFYPNDIQNILSKAFMLDVDSNAYFLYDSMIRDKINAVHIRDRYFEYFYQTMTHKAFKRYL